MALFAGLRHPSRHVIGIGCLLEVCQVAGDARCRSARILSSHVTLRTLHADVCPCEGKSRPVVIEVCVAPGIRIVAVLAGLRNSGTDVIRIRRLLEVRQVAGHAGRTQAGEHPAGVALRALRARMRTGQRELGHGVVIELHTQPVHRAVAHRTFLREARRLVGRILCSVEILQMATGAGGASAGEVVIQVTGGAIDARMRTRQRKAGELGMIELRAQPAIHRVALLAIRGVANAGVARVVGLRVVGGVARYAGSREANKLSGSRAFVALIAGK